jgi:hypothetical protein
MEKITKNNPTKIDEKDQYLGFVNMIEQTIERDKNKAIKEILQRGDDLLNEISKKRSLKERKKREMIDYIMDMGNPLGYKYVEPAYQTLEEYKNELINNYTHEELETLYEATKRKNRTFFQKVKDLFTYKNKN